MDGRRLGRRGRLGSHRPIGRKAEVGGFFLVGFRGRLFAVESDYQVGEAVVSYQALGCGEQIARGSLFSSSHLDSERRVRLALEAAEAHSAGGRGPFTVLSAGGGKK